MPEKLEIPIQGFHNGYGFTYILPSLSTEKIMDYMFLMGTWNTVIPSNFRRLWRASLKYSFLGWNLSTKFEGDLLQRNFTFEMLARLFEMNFPALQWFHERLFCYSSRLVFGTGYPPCFCEISFFTCELPVSSLCARLISKNLRTTSVHAGAITAESYSTFNHRLWF